MSRTLEMSLTRKLFVFSSEGVDLILEILDDNSGTSQFGCETLVLGQRRLKLIRQFVDAAL